MSSSLGDFDASTVIYGKFTSYRPSTGASYTLAGTPALSVYKDNSTTQSTTGVTLTADFDSVTGLNHFAIDTSADGTFYAAGSFFDVVITTGTVDSVSVTGSVVASFTIRKNSALKPTTAARTLDVSAGGEAGIDWANIGSPTTANNLSATNIDVDQVVASVSGAVGSVTGAVGSVTGLTASNLDVASSTLATAANLAVVAGYLDTEIAAIKLVTDALPNAGALTTIQADLDNIQTRIPAALVSGRMDANLAAIGDDTTALTAFKRAVLSNVVGTVGAASSTTSIVTSALTPAGAAADQFKGRILTFDKDTTTTALRGQATDITASTNAATPTFTVTALTTAPVSGDTFTVL